VRTWTKFLSYDEETAFRANEYLRERARRSDPEPFFLAASFHHPHDPFHVTQELWDLYADAPIDLPADATDVEVSAMDAWLNETHETGEVDLHDPDNLRALRRAYYGLVTYVDRKVGELVDTLAATGELDRTVIMFTSDHGDMLGERAMVQKRCFYEWSARVPLLIAFPDGRGAGRRVAQPVSMMDLAPTILDVAGVPAERRLPMDAHSLLPLIDGTETEARDVFSEYHVEKVHASCYLVRRGDLKYTYIHGHGGQLFDLATDPGERHNLAGDPAHAADERALHEAIAARFDLDGIAAASVESLRRRVVVNEAMVRNGVRWDYEPRFAQHGRYVR
jgi:choline-sulfatase